MAPHLYLIALGSNLGDRTRLLAAAAAALDGRLGQVVARAPAYETEPVGAADLLFLNSALVASSRLDPAHALACLLDIERELGRVRAEKWGNRAIDLDLLLWRPAGGESRVFESPELTIPHPHMLERDFVLVPACDVAPDWRHPVTGRTLGDELGSRGFKLGLRQ